MNKQYKKALIFTVLTSVLIAIFDIWAMNSGIFGKPDDYVLGTFTEGWWPLFFKFNLAVIILISFFYYFMIRKDKSETIAIFISGMGAWFSGIPDLLFFVFQGRSVPLLLPWLDNTPIVSLISKAFGYAHVTSTALLLSIIISLITLTWLDKLLEKIN